MVVPGDSLSPRLASHKKSCAITESVTRQQDQACIAQQQCLAALFALNGMTSDLCGRSNDGVPSGLLLKEVIQPQVPLRLPCYDFTPVIDHKVVTVLPKVRLATSFATNFHGVTGGVYKARERIHRSMLICDY